MSRLHIYLDFYLLSFVFVFICYITPVECLKCLQCSSLFDRGCRTGDVSPQPCYNESYIYCLKYETKDKDVKFVTRDCSNEYVSGCYDMNFQEKVVKICRSTCTEDGCNEAPSIHSKRSLTDHIIVMTFVGIIVVVNYL